MVHAKAVKDRVRKLREKGFSLNQIFQEAKVPKTTIRTWITDIVLSKEHRDVLRTRTQNALQKGRIKFQRSKKEERLTKERVFFETSRLEVGKLSKRELFLSGIALYWAEGFKNKHEHRLGFCNSDPSMIRFYIHWLQQCIGLKKNQLVVRLTLNQLYESKTNEIQSYWSKTLGIPSSQFTKPFYQNSKWKKQYNIDNYHGVLRVHVKESLDYLLKMKGWIEGLRLNVIK
ncbi:MAG: hypothetical protein Q7R31_02175 [Candidatus Levybacteria bacterium]|nr:hypothetical protein [Candidatus Levybacteria bacterium]